MLQRKNKWCGSVTGASKRAITFLPTLTMWRSMSLTALAFALRRDENSNCDRFEMARLNLINVRRHSDNRFCKVPIECYVTIYESITLTITIETVPAQSQRGYDNNIHIQGPDKKGATLRRQIKQNKAAFCHSLCNCLYKYNGLFKAGCKVWFVFDLLLLSGARKFLHAPHHLFAMCTVAQLQCAVCNAHPPNPQQLHNCTSPHCIALILAGC